MIVRLRTAIALRRSGVRDDARRQMQFVVGEQPDEVLDRLAAAYVERSIWRGESRWHPELVNRQEIVGVERLLALRDAGTGFLVNFVHLGDYEGISPSLAHAGIPNHNVATSEVFGPDAPIWMKQSAVVVTSHEDVTLLDVAVGSAGIRKVLAQGAAVAIATDQPGHTTVHFLGHELSLSSGAARIAESTGTPVAVLTTHPHPTSPAGCGLFKVAEVLDPADFDSAEALLEVMIRLHEEAFRAWPEAAEHPLRMTNDTLVRKPSSYRARDAGDAAPGAAASSG